MTTACDNAWVTAMIKFPARFLVGVDGLTYPVLALSE